MGDEVSEVRQEGWIRLGGSVDYTDNKGAGGEQLKSNVFKRFC